MNGSSVSGNCSDIDSISSACMEPRTGVLFDGVFPELTELDGDAWASQLLVTPSTSLSRYALSVLAFYFTDTPGYAGVARVEMALFNCPEWGIAVGTVAVQEFKNGRVKTLAIQSIRTTSCDSLVRICVPVTTNSTVIPIMFYSVPSPEFYVHLAEVTFYADSSACPPEAIISAYSVTTATATEGAPDPTTASSTGSNPTCSTQRGACPSCDVSNSWTPAVAATVTGLLAAVVLTLVQVAVCKCRTKLRVEELDIEVSWSQGNLTALTVVQWNLSMQAFSGPVKCALAR